jgi:hypothetical protein
MYKCYKCYLYRPHHREQMSRRARAHEWSRDWRPRLVGYLLIGVCTCNRLNPFDYDCITTSLRFDFIASSTTRHDATQQHPATTSHNSQSSPQLTQPTQQHITTSPELYAAAHHTMSSLPQVSLSYTSEQQATAHAQRRNLLTMTYLHFSTIPS